MDHRKRVETLFITTILFLLLLRPSTVHGQCTGLETSSSNITFDINGNLIYQIVSQFSLPASVGSDICTFTQNQDSSKDYLNITIIDSFISYPLLNGYYTDDVYFTANADCWCPGLLTSGTLCTNSTPIPNGYSLSFCTSRTISGGDCSGSATAQATVTFTSTAKPRYFIQSISPDPTISLTLTISTNAHTQTYFISSYPYFISMGRYNISIPYPNYKDNRPGDLQVTDVFNDGVTFHSLSEVNDINSYDPTRLGWYKITLDGTPSIDLYSILNRVSIQATDCRGLLTPTPIMSATISLRSYRVRQDRDVFDIPLLLTSGSVYVDDVGVAYYFGVVNGNLQMGPASYVYTVPMNGVNNTYIANSDANFTLSLPKNTSPTLYVNSSCVYRYLMPNSVSYISYAYYLGIMTCPTYNLPCFYSNDGKFYFNGYGYYIGSTFPNTFDTNTITLTRTAFFQDFSISPSHFSSRFIPPQSVDYPITQSDLRLILYSNSSSTNVINDVSPIITDINLNSGNILVVYYFSTTTSGTCVLYSTPYLFEPLTIYLSLTTNQTSFNLDNQDINNKFNITIRCRVASTFKTVEIKLESSNLPSFQDKPIVITNQGAKSAISKAYSWFTSNLSHTLIVLSIAGTSLFTVTMLIKFLMRKRSPVIKRVPRPVR